MEIKLEQLFTIDMALGALRMQRLPFSCSVSIRKIIAELKPALEEARSRNQAIADLPEKEREASFKDLLNVQVEIVTTIKLKASDLGAVSISAIELEALEPFIEGL